MKHTDPRNTAGAAPRSARAPITGSWRIQSREGAASARTPTGSHELPRLGTGGARRSSSQLPRRLLLGRLVRGGALFGLATLAAVGVVQVASWVEKSHALPVRTIAVRGAAADGADLSKDRADEIRAYAAVASGTPLLTVDTDAVAQRVLEHPFVASATVRRVLPDGIEIVVKERAPKAALAVDGGLYLVDAAGAVMKAARPGDGLDLPVVTGVDAADVASGAASAVLAQAVAVLDAHAAASAPGGPASEVHVVPMTGDIAGGAVAVGFDLVLEDGTRARLGGKDIEAKVARMAAALAQVSAAGRRASFIYLDDERRPERAAVRLRPESESAPAGGENNKIPRERG